MYQPIRCQDGNVGLWIALKNNNTCWGHIEEISDRSANFTPVVMEKSKISRPVRVGQSFWIDRQTDGWKNPETCQSE